MVTVIGITGGIGSGKSTASQILRELGAEVIDADQVGHKIYLPDTPGWREIVEAYGDDVLAPDRTIDRSKLGPIVFADPKALEIMVTGVLVNVISGCPVLSPLLAFVVGHRAPPLLVNHFCRPSHPRIDRGKEVSRTVLT